MDLRFERVCAWVNTDYEQPGVLTRLHRAVSRQVREAAQASQKKQVSNPAAAATGWSMSSTLRIQC